MTGYEIKTIINSLYPEPEAYDWDNVGLQVGSLETDITGILIALDVTMDVIEEAIANKANMILAHHPLLFRPLQQIDTDHLIGKIIEKAIKEDIVIYAAHTNFDVAPTGMNHILAHQLQLKNQEPLDILNETSSLGIFGNLQETMILSDYISVLKDQLKIDHVRLIGDETKPISRVAIAGGSGSSVIPAAMRQAVDVLVTGDITYHYALDARSNNLTILDVGHHIEKQALPKMKEQLVKAGITTPITVSNVETNLYKIL
jgi:dinuclear metal center YbgI/SA1388 family protein